MIRELKDLGVQDLGSGLFGKGVLNLPNIEVYEADTYKKKADTDTRRSGSKRKRKSAMPIIHYYPNPITRRSQEAKDFAT